MKRSFIIVSIDKCAYDRDILSDYLYHSGNVLQLLDVNDGFFVDYCYETDSERKAFIGKLMKLDIHRIEFYDVLYEEFLKDGL